MPLAVDINVPSSAAYLQQKIDDLDAAIQEYHSGKMFDAAKNLLETVFRTIITDINGQVVLQNGREPSLPNLYDQTKACFQSLSNERNAAIKFDELCKRAVHVIGYCRNNYGASSHGQDAYTTFDINPIEALFVSNISISIVNFLYGTHIAQPTSYQNVRLIYGNFSSFNGYLDDVNEMVTISGIAMSPSEALFMTDQNAYRELLIEYTEHQSEEFDVNDEN